MAADFLALGFCRLQVELLTRQMRYSTNIDESQFQRDVLAAATAAVAHDAAESRVHLSKCFDLLNESRKYFYPVDSYLVDLTLVASTTLGVSLASALQNPSPANLLVTAELLQTVFDHHPDSWRALCEALDAGRLSLVGENIASRICRYCRPRTSWPIWKKERPGANACSAGVLMSMEGGATD